MASTIVEVDAFTASIVAPDAGDSRADAAEVVTAIAQKLTNRTLYLNNRTAKLANSNTFTAAPQKVSVTDNGLACLQIDESSLDDLTYPGNGWKLIEQLAADQANRKVRRYSGGNDASGLLAETVNAFWHVSDSHWRSDDPSKASYARFIVAEGTVLATRSAAENTAGNSWSAWPTNEGNLTLGGDVLFAAPKRIRKFVNIAACSGAVLINSDTTVSLATYAGGNVVAWPIQLPPLSRIVSVDVNYNQNDAGQPSVLRFKKRTVLSTGWAGGTVIATPSVIKDTQSGSGTGMKGISLDPSGGSPTHFPVVSTEEYQVTFELGAPGTSLTAPLDAVHGISVVFDYYGPSNA